MFEPDFWREGFTQLLNHVNEGVHIADRNGITRFYNDSAAAIDGIEQTTALGKHILEMFPSLTEQTSTILQVLRTGEKILHREQEIRNLYGVPVYLVTTTVPIKVNGKILAAMDISQNLTQVKTLAEKVVGLQADLKAKHKHTRAEQAIYTFDNIYGEHPALLDVLSRARKAARTDSPILVCGETGTGKELLVQSIHNAGPRRQAPFISQNCAALPATLMESILFGTAKGSFTGAENRPGLVELADGGTLFLDEITCLDPDLQAKLLRFIQEGSIRRLGETRLRNVNVRIMASTNIDPLQAVRDNRLRADLYYRLNVVNLSLPALRDRRNDIPLLISRLISDLNQKLGCQISGISPDVHEICLRYPWPGNIRELYCTLEGAMNLADAGQLEISHLPPYLLQKLVQNPPVNLKDVENLPLQEALSKVEETLIRSALGKSAWNISRTARILGLPRQTLQYKIQSLRIERDSPED
ncbi:arginine utilization regulatory protein RocR [Peptococcaceae bacterium CEB3]|nr:arginine utilization regulatory protein RocR [Peptococcaceae bacterium CEB3]